MFLCFDMLVGMDGQGICTLLIFVVSLQFSSKQLERFAKKAEKEQKAQQGKVKKVSVSNPAVLLFNVHIHVFDFMR